MIQDHNEPGIQAIRARVLFRADLRQGYSVKVIAGSVTSVQDSPAAAAGRSG
jgi:hypothetical protein